MSGILLGLLGGGFIGVSDCVARFTAQRTSLSVLILYVMGISSVLMTVWFLASGDWPRWDFTVGRFHFFPDSSILRH